MSGSTSIPDLPAEPDANTRNPLARVRRFALLYLNVARDGMGHSAVRVAVITAVSFLGALAQGATIGALSVFLGAIQSEAPTTVPVVGIEIGADGRSLLLLIITLFALQVASAVAVYYAAVSSRALGRRYHQVTAMRILDRFESARAIKAKVLPQAPVAIRRAIATQSRILGKATETMLASIQVVCYAAAFLVMLFVLSVGTTLLVLPIFVFVLPFLYRLGSATQGTAKSFYGRSVQEMTAAVRRHFDDANRNNLDVPADAERLADRYLHDPAVREYYDSYDEIQLAASRSNLVTSLFRPFVLCLILLVLGSFALRESYSWEVILPYALALWQFLNSVQQLAGQFAVLYRFHPRIAAYNEVSTALGNARVHGDSRPLRKPIEIRSVEGLEGGAERINIERGDRVLYVVGARLSRIGFDELIAPLVACSSTPRGVWIDARFVAHGEAPPGVALAALVLGAEASDAARRRELETRLEGLGVENEIAALPGGLDAVLDRGAWESLGRRARAAILVLALAETPADLVFLDFRILDEIDAAGVAALLGVLAKKAVFLVTGNPRSDCGEADCFVFADDGVVAGAGDGTWWRSISAERSQLRPARRIDDERAGGEDAEEEDVDL